MRVDKDFKQKPEINFRLVLIGFLISTSIIIVTTPVHEAVHWIISDIDPYVEPVEFHVFDETLYQNDKHILPSFLGYVVIKEKYPGAFHDRPWWTDMFQEIICISIQIVIAVITSLKITTCLINRKRRVLLSMNHS